LDILFGENVHNSDGCLQHIMRGPFGMDMVVQYIEEATATGELLVDAAMPKIERLVKELQFLISSPYDASKKTAEKRKPAAKTMTDGSGEDDNNDYTPPRRAHPEPPSPSSVFGTDGEENIEDTKQGEALVSHKIHLSSLLLTNY
ncbi:hypothetical protein L208DRAFT_1292928, partial [Tricholoma matsutake]